MIKVSKTDKSAAHKKGEVSAAWAKVRQSPKPVIRKLISVITDFLKQYWVRVSSISDKMSSDSIFKVRFFFI
jgi:hypothetical protein